MTAIWRGALRSWGILVLPALVLAPCSSVDAQAAVGRGAAAPLHTDLMVGPGRQGHRGGPRGPRQRRAGHRRKERRFTTRRATSCRATSSRRRTSTRTATCGATRGTFAAILRSASRRSGARSRRPRSATRPPASAAWGYCDRDYPRDQIVSPYPFTTAKQHYEAMLADATKRGGPTTYTQATLPNWNGNYRRDASKTATWYHGAVLQIPTYLTLADAGIPDAVRSADVPLRRHQCAAVAGFLLPARRVHAPDRAVLGVHARRS